MRVPPSSFGRAQEGAFPRTNPCSEPLSHADRAQDHQPAPAWTISAVFAAYRLQVNALRGGLLGGGRVTLDQAQYLSPPHPRESCVGGPEASPLCHCRSHFPLPRGYDSEAGRCWAPGMSPQRGRRSDHLHWRSRRQSGSRQASVRVRVRVRSRGRPGRRHGGVRAEPAPRVAQVCSSEHIAEYI